MTLTFVVPGPPVGKQRARVTRKGYAYTPAKTVNYEALIKQCFAAKYPGHLPYEGPVSIGIQVYMTPSKEIARKIAKGAIIYCVKRPDCSNVLKSIEDALNGLAYKDDAQIWTVDVKKLYGEKPYVAVRIWGFSQTTGRGEEK